MTDDYDFIGIKSVKQFERQRSKNVDAVLEMANHVKRGLQGLLGAKPHITESRTFSNYSLHGLNEPKAIQNYVNSQIALAGIKPQRNNVMLISVVFSLPVTWHKKDTSKYFEGCYKWILKAFDCELITFDVHLDENAPHAHALLLPIMTDQKTGKKKLGASYILGGKARFNSLLDSFYEEVTAKHGLKRKRKLRTKEKEELANKLLNQASGANDSMFKSAFFQVIRDCIYQFPEKFAAEIELELKEVSKPKRTRNFVDIKRSKGKGTFIK